LTIIIKKGAIGMRIKMFVVILLPLLVLTLAGVSQAWQGRMGGMGDPYGLLADESDFLIHPAKIAGGEGTRLYGGYQFTYRGVTAWDYNLDWFLPTIGISMGSREYDTSGEEMRHDALVGIAMPVGVGRMGIFFEYAGARGDYDGDGYWITPAFPNTYDLTSDLDDFTVSLLYGLPVGSFQLGGEFQFAYREEENKSELYNSMGSSFINNTTAGYSYFTGLFDGNLLPFMLPYDSSYMEALFKGSLQGTLGPVDVEFALRGGFIFGGDNQLQYAFIAGGTPTWGTKVDGSVEGWQIGGDLWMRYPLSNDLSLPFLVRVDYQSKTRDGDEIGLLNWSYGYESEEKGFVLEAGGGVDAELAAGTRVAAGIYYSYHDIKNDFFYQMTPVGLIFDHRECPYLTEHRATLRLAGEFELSPMATVRMGFTPFIGWVREDFGYTDTGIGFPNSDDISLDGMRWGVEGSFGGSIRFNGFTMEPFVSGGYQEYDLSGDGGTTLTGTSTLVHLTEMDLTRHEWYIGGGISFLLGL
jgi:hypothetical protein